MSSVLGSILHKGLRNLSTVERESRLRRSPETIRQEGWPADGAVWPQGGENLEEARGLLVFPSRTAVCCHQPAKRKRKGRLSTEAHSAKNFLVPEVVSEGRCCLLQPCMRERGACGQGLNSGRGDFCAGWEGEIQPRPVITHRDPGSLPGHPPSHWVPGMVSELLMTSSCIQNAHSFFFFFF